MHSSDANAFVSSIGTIVRVRPESCAVSISYIFNSQGQESNQGICGLLVLAVFIVERKVLKRVGNMWCS